MKRFIALPFSFWRPGAHRAITAHTLYENPLQDEFATRLQLKGPDCFMHVSAPHFFYTDVLSSM